MYASNLLALVFLYKTHMCWLNQMMTACQLAKQDTVTSTITHNHSLNHTNTQTMLDV